MEIVPFLVHINNNISNINNILINELKQKTRRCNILDNNQIKKLNNKSIIDILFESEQTIICININYSDNKGTSIESNNFVNSVKEINKLNKSNKKFYAIYLSKLEPLQSCKTVFNKENINFEKTSNIKFITVYTHDKGNNLEEEYINLLKRLQIKLHSLGIYYYDQDDSVIMSNF